MWKIIGSAALVFALLGCQASNATFDQANDRRVDSTYSVAAAPVAVAPEIDHLVDAVTIRAASPSAPAELRGRIQSDALYYVHTSRKVMIEALAADGEVVWRGTGSLWNEPRVRRSRVKEHAWFAVPLPAESYASLRVAAIQ